MCGGPEGAWQVTSHSPSVRSLCPMSSSCLQHLENLEERPTAVMEMFKIHSFLEEIDVPGKLSHINVYQTRRVIRKIATVIEH